MKIAQIDVNYEQGSTGKIVETIHKHLISSKHQSRVYYGRGQKCSEPGIIKISHDLATYLDAGLSRMTGYTGIFSPAATNKLINYLEIFQPDVVHLHELHGYYLNYFDLLKYLKDCRIPVVWTLHCENAYTGRCGSAFDCEQWKTACKKCPRLNDYPSSLLFDRSQVQFERKRKLMSDMDMVSFAPVSKWLHNRLKQSFLKDKPAYVVHNGINTTDVFLPCDYTDLIKRHHLDGRYVVLSVAPDLMSPRKGGQWVLEVAKRMQDKPVTFIMIGVKEKSLNCSSNVIYLAPIRDKKELAKYYSLADIFLITSQSETFSLTCAESLACGTPIVGFDSGGPTEVAPEPFGYFVPYARIDDLVSLISRSQSGNLQNAKGDDCIKHAKSSFSNDRMCKDYLHLYEEMNNLST